MIGEPQKVVERALQLFSSMDIPRTMSDDELPVADVDFTLLFGLVNPENCTKLIELMLAERSILWVAQSLQTVSEAIQAFVTLLYPFQSPHAYSALLPAD